MSETLSFEPPSTSETSAVEESLSPNPEVIGKVASPPNKESTSEEFYFWVRDDVLVERGQIVRTELVQAGETIRFFGVVREVYRQSRLKSLAEERDRYDGDTDYRPPHEIPGVMFAVVTILRSVPEVACPPFDGADVVLGDAEDARLAYAADEIEHSLAIGLVKNGARLTVGPGDIDLDYVLGANGGHVNVTGVAGRGTKSSFLLHMNYLLLEEAKRQKRERPSDPDRLKVVPLILNVKNFDLFHIDRSSRRFDPAKFTSDWQKLGIDQPQPFTNVRYLAPQQASGTNPVETGRSGGVMAYSYSLSDVIQRELFQFLFADDDLQDINFGTLVMAVEDWLTRETTSRDGERTRILRADGPQTFQELLESIDQWSQDSSTLPVRGSHHTGTVRKFHRRLLRMILEGRGVLRRDERQGQPLHVTSQETTDPTVIDLSSLARVPTLQRFVVATIFRQLVEDRTGSRATSELTYLVTLDELNRFAPRGAKDPVTRLVEHVAAEMRSQGIILFGAQQQASLVSARVIENAGLRVLGKTGSLELGEKVWRFLSSAARSKAMQLSPDEKMLIQDSFREPMLVRIPFPPWALRRQEAVLNTATNPTDIDEP
ncbi:MAG: ATP-binding protein [Planctomycetaceae bacterium]|nr:ATP-binding protein [Planctomycetaceae bacterium]